LIGTTLIPGRPVRLLGDRVGQVICDLPEPNR
jgi:hypothetical protein